MPPLALAVLPFVLFAPATAMWRVFSAQDLQAYFYPYHVLAARIVAEGHLPLWNPHVFSGIPLLGDGQTAMFYPPNWLFFVLPGETALNLVALLQFSIAGTGMYLFARTLGLSRLPAFTAGLAYMFSGALSARIVHLSIMSGAALVPVVLACVDRSFETSGRRARRWCAAAAASVACQLVSGHPQVPIYTALAVALYAVVRAAERATAGSGWRAVRPVVLVAPVYALGCSLAAVQLVPWVELARLSVRAADAPYDLVFGTASRGADWLLFLFPYLLGAHGASVFASGSFPIEQAVRVWEHSAYVGVLPLGLALVAIGHLVELGLAREMRQARGAEPSPARHRLFSLVFLMLLLLASVLIAAGSQGGLSHVVYALPVFGKLRGVERTLVLAAVALAALAGFGLQRVVERERRRRWLLVPAILVAAIPAAFVAHAQLRPSQPFAGVAAEDLARFSILFPHTYVPLLLCAAAALLVGWWARGPAGIATQALAIALVLGDLALYTTSFTPTAPRRVYRTKPRVVDVMRTEPALFRKATVLVGSNDLAHRPSQHALAMSWALVHGIDDVNGFNSLQPRRYTDYLFGRRVNEVSYGYLRDERLFDPAHPVLSSLNVRFVLVPRDTAMPLGSHLRPTFENAHVTMYENALAYPRAYFVARVRTEANPRAVLRRVTAPGFDGRREALVEGGPLPPVGAADGPATAEARRDGPNELQVTTTTAATRFLVVSEMYFPGWRAYLDGVEVPIHRVNYLFRGIVVPAGRHTVRFVYRPASVLVGAAVSSLAVLALVALAALRGHERRPSGSSRADGSPRG